MVNAKDNAYVVGVDYGSSSVRAVVADARDGRELSAAVYEYPCGIDGVITSDADPDIARQDPRDYMRGFDATVSRAVQDACSSCCEFSPELVVGIGVDATASTPIPVDRSGRALCENAAFDSNIAAMAWLWKDHSSWQQAERITERAIAGGWPYLGRCGGAYSSEWFWSKILRCLEAEPEVFDAAFSWVEQVDFICGYITGNRDPLTMKRSVCAAGHKAMYDKSWGGLPSKEFLAALNPSLAELRDRLYESASAVNVAAGQLDAELAARVGLPAGIPVATGAIDAHLGAVGAGISPATLVKILGTSSCDMMIAPAESAPQAAAGVCGIVDDSIVPGYLGIEAGQSAVGDIFNWFVAKLAPVEFSGADAHQLLSEQAANLRPGQSGLLALDWNNGNRSVLADPLLSGLLVGQNLHTTAPEIYRALIEASAFGALTIIDHIDRTLTPVEKVIVCGGIAEKNPLVMQIYADICRRPMAVSQSSQSCALGAAICAAVVGGVYESITEAQRHMAAGVKRVYQPDEKAASVYARLYELYRTLHDSFGGVAADNNAASNASIASVMKQLIEIRRQVGQSGQADS